MSSKVIISVIVLLLIVVGAWYFIGQSAKPIAPAGKMGIEDPLAPVPGTQSAGQQDAPTLGTGASDADLDADLQALDSQISAAGDASTDAATFSDTPVEQTE